jgi:hypothetical protein
MPYIYGQLQNAQFENSVGNPASGGTPLGRVYIDITNSAAAVAKYYNGSAYVSFGSGLMTANTTSTVTFNTSGNSETVYNSSASTLGSLTLALPVTSSVGQILRYFTAGAVTTVTVTGTVIGAALTSMSANQTVIYQAVNTTGTFVRIQ